MVYWIVEVRIVVVPRDEAVGNRMKYSRYVTRDGVVKSGMKYPRCATQDGAAGYRTQDYRSVEEDGSRSFRDAPEPYYWIAPEPQFVPMYVKTPARF